VLVLIGGHVQIEAALAAQNITAGPAQFWTPPHAENTFYSMDDPEVLYDAYGRAVQASAQKPE